MLPYSAMQQAQCIHGFHFFYTPVLCPVHIPQHLCQFTYLCVLRGRSVVCLFSLQEHNAKENVSSRLEWRSMINQEITAN